MSKMGPWSLWVAVGCWPDGHFTHEGNELDAKINSYGGGGMVDIQTVVSHYKYPCRHIQGGKTRTFSSSALLNLKNMSRL